MYQIHTFLPQDFKNYLNNRTIFYSYYQTNAGTLKILATEDGIFKATYQEDFTKEETLYIFQEKIDPSKLILVGTNFQQVVWKATLSIASGRVASYQSLAESIAKPKAYRAVAQALAKNKIAYFIPCHRIINKNGKLGGYKWGIEKKRLLLESERVL